MNKIIYLIAIFIITSTQAKDGVLVKILDGDTLYFKTEDKINKCKVAYINTPENRYNNKLKQDVEICKNIPTKVMLNAGESATKHANKLLKIGNNYSYSSYTKNSEQICEVSLGNGMTFSEKMLLDGYAVVWKVNKKQKDEQNFSSVLTHAKNKNNGLWRDNSQRGEVIKCLEKISIKDVTYELINKNTIVAEYQRCFCGNVKKVKTTFPNLTYCEWGTEFNRQYFSSAVDKPVEVELIKSVISGSDSCKYVIHI